jgi:hypothetical protein
MTQYIDKDALVAEIGKRLYEYSSLKLYDACTEARASELGKLLVILNTLEVKEVDLEKEIKEEYLKRRCCGGRDNMLVILNEPQFNKIAKHFFELGMAVSNKAQKGE